MVSVGGEKKDAEKSADDWEVDRTSEIEVEIE